MNCSQHWRDSTLLADILETEREKEDKNDSSDDSEESGDELNQILTLVMICRHQM